MILVANIFIALASLAVTAYAFFQPSAPKLNSSYVLTALTLVSGTYLVASRPGHIVQACITGLIYLGVIFAGIVATHLKMHNSQHS